MPSHGHIIVQDDGETLKRQIQDDVFRRKHAIFSSERAERCDVSADIPVRRGMTRAELMDAAIKKLNEVATLLTIAGEDRLAADAQELAEWVDFSSPTLSANVNASN
jgi:hypothetical protein